MESYILDWANLLLRWVHVITAMAWIGASLYFVMLDNSLEKPTDQYNLLNTQGNACMHELPEQSGKYFDHQNFIISSKILYFSIYK